MKFYNAWLNILREQIKILPGFNFSNYLELYYVVCNNYILSTENFGFSFIISHTLLIIILLI